MRAKFKVSEVKPFDEAIGGELISFFAVTEKPFSEQGFSDDNSFARWTPTGNLTMQIQNPDIIGKFIVGEKFYLDFTRADETPAT